MKAQKVQDIIAQAYPHMVNAASSEEVDSVYNQMMSDLDAAGIAEVEDAINETYAARMGAVERVNQETQLGKYGTITK